ncbi:beta-N-acetylhexosaminidase [Lichenihabitans sp. Uapishka_5]|uniref:beta-N-acetylhexosaminidase n=1 Tax=Lichenihabitans sp. Uapishka_5 TaxID=3037302 RepID=UPI0029E7D59A|nr:beta-N-acetylhexosaminidase [Lichenihabitans sp. Uapishka_5]MDX7949636.1 beta-N-acetylhexosaminidase [Lichenihabitans sp. Uapishka_5]
MDVVPKAFVCGCEGLALSDDERRFLTDEQPWGLILFKRNVQSPTQLRALTAAFREAVGRSEAPVLIDQEGGRVQRLGPPHWPLYPAAAAYASLTSEAHQIEAATLGGRLIASDLRDAGITVDCAPVLDVPAPGSHHVVGNRAFGADPDTVARLGRAFANGLLHGGVLPVIKHVPGHGRGMVDSHHDLPVVDATLEELERTDFRPFIALADLPAAMTAHVVYSAIDPEQPATISRIVQDTIIRGALGFTGLLLSDDLSMQALKGSLRERAMAAAMAGCDILLHCNGKLDEARQVAEAAPRLAGLAAERASKALTLIAREPSTATADERSRFEALLDALV